jgi:hypothetical protein
MLSLKLSTSACPSRFLQVNPYIALSSLVNGMGMGIPMGFDAGQCLHQETPDRLRVLVQDE